MFAVAAPSQAEVVLGSLFRDGAVLQRELPLPIWGRAAPGEPVGAMLGSNRAHTVADSSGRWRLALPPQAASAIPLELVVEGSNRIVVRNILIGEVWLCSGQSNMMMAAKNARDAAREAEATGFPEIRHFKVPARFAEDPQETLDGNWVACTSETFGAFSAVSVYFARMVGRELGVPVGIINASYGNTPIASWREPKATIGDPGLASWWAEQLKGTSAPRPHRRPSACYNGMVHPLAPYALRGILWYQGESDASEAVTLTPLYSRQFTGLIQEWRHDFERPDLPFYWVQLAGFGRAAPRAWVQLREAQSAPLVLPGTGQAIAIDVGDATDIHPKNKQAVGERLARLALRRVYSRAIEDTGPEPGSLTARVGDVQISFSHAPGGLVTEGDVTGAFELAGADGVFHPATRASVDGETVVVSARPVTSPVTVRFSWQDLPAGFLRNRAGLPAAPFRLSIPNARPP